MVSKVSNSHIPKTHFRVSIKPRQQQIKKEKQFEPIIWPT
jgi:hypothetical protein